MKFSTEEIVEAMRDAKVSPDDMDSTIKNLEKMQDKLKEERVRGPKKKFVILASTGDLQRDLQDASEIKISETPMWVLQINEDDDHNEITNNIKKTLKAHNATSRKPINVETLGEAIRELPKKALSAFGVFLKTKEPVIVVETNNSVE